METLQRNEFRVFDKISDQIKLRDVFSRKFPLSDEQNPEINFSRAAW